jgi:hypothetical protein
MHGRHAVVVGNGVHSFAVVWIISRSGMPGAARASPRRIDACEDRALASSLLIG